MFSARTKSVLLAAIAATCCSAAAKAQVLFDRKIDAVAVVPAEGGPRGLLVYQVILMWHVEVGQTTSTLPLATEAVLMVNGVQRSAVSLGVAINGGTSVCGDFAGCQGSCGSWSAGAVGGTLLCVTEGPCIPDCQSCHCQTPPIQTPFPPEPFDPGDEITVILRPAPGGLPEQNPAPDVRTVVLEDGKPVFWDRRIDSVELVPTPGGGPDQFDVKVMWGFGGNFGRQDVNLTPIIEVLVNGQLAGFVNPCGNWLVAPGGNSGCLACDGSDCGIPSGPCSNIEMRCGLIENNQGQAFCGCRSTSAPNTIPGVILRPLQDRIIVRLRPAPGGLPTLPGFEDDDEEELPQGCAADFDGDGVVGAADLAILLGLWGNPGVADISGNGTVGAEDLALLLGQWGVCFPV